MADNTPELRLHILLHHIALYLVRTCGSCGGTDTPLKPRNRCEKCSLLHDALLDMMEVPRG